MSSFFSKRNEKSMESIILLLAVAGGALLLMAAVKARCIQTFVIRYPSLFRLASLHTLPI